MVALQRAAFEAVLVPLLPESFSLSSIEDWERSLADVLAIDGVRGLVKEDVDGLAGLVIFGLNRDADSAEGVGEIRALFAHPARRRRGTGRSLVARACEELAAMGYGEVTLWSLGDNKGATAFYEALGFDRDGTTQVRAAFAATEVRYRRSLDS